MEAFGRIRPCVLCLVWFGASLDQQWQCSCSDAPKHTLEARLKPKSSCLFALANAPPKTGSSQTTLQALSGTGKAKSQRFALLLQQLRQLTLKLQRLSFLLRVSYPVQTGSRGGFWFLGLWGFENLQSARLLFAIVVVFLLLLDDWLLWKKKMFIVDKRKRKIIEKLFRFFRKHT